MPQVGAAYKQYKNQGLEIFIVLGENQYKQKPNLAYCKAYANQMGIPLDRMFIDYGSPYGPWQTLFTNVYPYLPADGTLNLPWEAVLDGDSMVYEYCSLAGPHANVVDALNAELAD